MFYKLQISGISELDSTSTDGKNAAIQEIEIKSDTIDDYANARSTDVLLRVTVKFEINNETKDICKEIMQWSLQSGGSDVYKDVEITISDAEENQIRYFKIPKMFCDDYTEHFVPGNSQNYAEIKLIQKGGNFGDVSNET